MTDWTEEDEARFQEAVKTREKCKEVVGLRAAVTALRKLADDLEKGVKDAEMYQVDTEFLYHRYMGMELPSAYAKKITLLVPLYREQSC